MPNNTEIQMRCKQSKRRRKNIRTRRIVYGSSIIFPFKGASRERDEGFHDRSSSNIFPTSGLVLPILFALTTPITTSQSLIQLNYELILLSCRPLNDNNRVRNTRKWISKYPCFRSHVQNFTRYVPSH